MLKVIKPILFTLIIISFTTSCSEDDDASIPDPSMSFDLIIENERGVTIDVYVRNDDTQSNFENKGRIVTGQEITISNLATETNYTLRAVEQGNSISNFFYERPFSSDLTGTRRIIIQ